MSYGLEEYWNDLDQALVEFNSKFYNLIHERTTDEDQATYHTLVNTLLKILKLGRAMNNTLWPGEKIALGKAMDVLPLETYGNSQVPPIHGPLSLAFCEHVYLPHLSRFERVEFNPILLQLSKLIGTDLEMKKTTTQGVVDNFRRHIAKAKATWPNNTHHQLTTATQFPYKAPL